MNRYLSSHGTVAAFCVLACGHASGAPAFESIGGQTPPAFLSTAGAGVDTIHCTPVDDDLLAQQTGRYAGNPMISGFVLNLLSQWQLPNGATALAQGALSVAQNAAHQVSAQIQTLAKVVDPRNGTTAANSGANPDAIATGGQNVSVNGVAQITQVAGNGNVGSNAAQIDYSSNAAQLANLTGGSASPVASAANADGTVKAGIAFANGSVTMALQTPAGIATQSIVPGNAQQAGAIAQLLQIAGNHQQVTNQMQLILQTQSLSGDMIRQIGVLQAIRNNH